MTAAPLCRSLTFCKGPPTQVVVTYTTFLMSMCAMFHFIAEHDNSAILTMSVMFQCLSMALLALQSWSSKSAAGISAQSLVLEVLALVCRMSSTVWFDGYLPADKSGDWFFQTVDFCSLTIALWLLHRVLVVQKDSYQAEEDTLPVAPIVLGSLALAMLLHGNMDDSPVFDTLWMAGLFLGVAGVVPQLWLITRMHGRTDALTCHYVAAMAIGRLLSGYFWWDVRGDLTCDQWIQGINHITWVILAAHALHFFLLGDFAYYYGVALSKQGLGGRLDLNLPLFV